MLDAKVQEKIVAKYKTDIFNQVLNDMESQSLNSLLKAKSKFFENLSSQLNLAKTTLTRSSIDNISIYMIPFKDDKDKLLLVKGLNVEGKFMLVNEYLLDREMQGGDKGKVMVSSSNGDKLSVSFEDGSKTYQNQTTQKSGSSAKGKVSVAVDDCLGNHGGVNFCQKEPGEAFSTCYKAEVDEFCDAVVSCAALLYWQVQALIIASCSCSATLCPGTV